MDPYLEDRDLWSDVHATLIPLIREALTPALPAGYAAKIDQYVWVQEEDEDEWKRRGKPDVFVSNGHNMATGPGRSGAASEPTEQVTLPALRRRRGNRHIVLVDSRRKKVVTVIELLSPSNKEPGEDQKQYLKKRTEYFGAGTNVVEIDLLRYGDRVPMGHPKGAPADYYILVTRAAEFPKADLWAFTVRDPIPPVSVPLKPEHGSIPLDLRRCLDHAYDAAEYGPQIDYTQPPVPALRPVDAEWAGELLKKHAKRKKK
jgi:hypothetical protein